MAAQVKLAPASASLAARWSGVMDDARDGGLAPGLVTATELVIAQVKLVEPAEALAVGGGDGDRVAPGVVGRAGDGPGGRGR